MNILLIGGGGFLGLNIAKALCLSEHVVHIADLNNKTYIGLSGKENVQIHQLDCANVDSVLNLIEALKIECVINLASSLIPSSSYDAFAQEWTKVVEPAFRLLNELAIRNIKYIYFSSGGAIYGECDQQSVIETSPKTPINYYGLSKSLFEECILFVSRTRGLNYIIVRPSNAFGLFQNPSKKQGLIAVAVERIKNKQPIEIWGDGLVVRDYIWAGDIAQGLANLIDRNLWGEIYNFGSGVGHSINTVLEMIQAQMGIEAEVIYTPARSVDVSHIVLDIQKIQSAIPFHPISLEEGIALYLDSLS